MTDAKKLNRRLEALEARIEAQEVALGQMASQQNWLKGSLYSLRRVCEYQFAQLLKVQQRMTR